MFDRVLSTPLVLFNEAVSSSDFQKKIISAQAQWMIVKFSENSRAIYYLFYTSPMELFYENS